MRSLFAPREEERSSDYLWLDADHLLSWLWWLSKGEAFSPRFLQSLESSGFLGMSVEGVLFPVLGSAGTGHAVPLTGLCALASAFTAECSARAAYQGLDFAFNGLPVQQSQDA